MAGKNLFKEVKKETAIAAISVIVLGILLLLGTFDILCTVLGVIFLVVGAAYLILYIVNLLRGTRASYQIMLAATLFIAGVIFFFKSGELEDIINLIVAALLVFDGATKLDDSFGILRGRRIVLGLLVLLFAAAALTLGVLILFSVVGGMNAIGWILIADGVLDLLTLLFLSFK